MEKLTSIRQLFNSPYEELLSYFKGLKFKGKIVEISDYTDNPQLSWACGKIEDISINGEANFLCPKFLYLPSNFKQYIKKGTCEFVAIPDSKSLKSEKAQYKLRILSVKNITEAVKIRDVQKESTLRHNLKLKDTFFIGLFTKNIDGSYSIRDIRRSDFSKLILQNGKPQSPIVYHPHGFKPKDGKYYEFSWILNTQRDGYVYCFVVDESKPIKEISPKDLIQRLHNDIMSYPAGAGQKIVKMLDTLKNQLTASGKEIFIYELLQNANDYPQINNATKEPVDVEFHLTLSSLVFMHSGAEFNEKNIAAICSINDKEKDTNKDAIGYKGIGFKTVFLDNDNVYIQTGGYSFRFDKQVTKDIVDTPWQILPILTPFSELSNAERAIFTHADEKFRVKIALRPTKEETLRTSARNYEQMFKDVFSNERVILFIPNLSSVKIFLKGTPIPDIERYRNTEKWRIDDFEEDIDTEITKAINADIEDQEDSGSLKIPTKYYDFNKTKVSFACEVNGKKLKEVSDSTLYCYLPAKEAKWGLKFLMNTDMIPNGPRDNIEVEFPNTINVNEEISRIAGSKFFDWIHKLCCSGLYEIDSIFALIPNFNLIKQGRDKFRALIDVFKEGFISRILEDEIIPTNDGYSKLSKTILDETGLSSFGIVSDSLFSSWMGLENCVFPSQEARQSSNLKSFIRTYLKEFDCKENIFDIDSLRELVHNQSFVEWLKNQNNNNKFIQFLIDKNLLDDFANKPIFINEINGDLATANDLYFNVDTHLHDLSSFSEDKYLSRVSTETKKYFIQNEKFNDFANNNFRHFDSAYFVSKLFDKENKSSTIKKLSEKNNSIRFVHFLAIENVEVDEIPLYNSYNELIGDNSLLFFDYKNEVGYDIAQKAWLPKNAYVFISKDYLLRDKAKVESWLSRFGVREFSEEIIIKEIILADCNVKTINDNIKNCTDSIDFVSFLERNESFIPEKELNSSYNLYLIHDGKSLQNTIDSNTFFASSLYDSYDSLSWNDNWLYQLDEEYFNGLDESKKLSRINFLERVFGVRNLSKEIFYNEFIANQLNELNKIITKDRNKNVDFWRWVMENISSKVEDLFSLKIIVNDVEGKEKYENLEDTTVYMSDVYMPESNGIEDFVKEYITNAVFVSPIYIENTKNTRTKWNSFWTNLNVSADITNILIENIIPDLKNIENDNLPSLLWTNWNKLKDIKTIYSDLKHLKLRCRDNQYYSMNDCCIINVESKKEPFVCVSIENEYNLRNNVDIIGLITQIADNNNIEIVSSCLDWRVKKIDKYLQLQDDGEITENVHFSFIKEIVGLSEDEFVVYKDQVEKIQLLSKDNDYFDADDLTLGHLYNPICDFEANGVKSLTYLSEEYHHLSIDESKLCVLFKIHRSFQKEDIALLENNPTFTKYIWHTYSKNNKQFNKLKEFAQKKYFDNYPCLLSQAGNVCRPEDLYSEVTTNYIKDYTEDWKSKSVDSLMISNNYEILSYFNLKTSLDFSDTLTALLYNHTKESRKTLLGWLCEGVEDKNAVADFLNNEKATWKNCNGEDIQIKNIYAISPNNERLLSYFRKHISILDVSYVNKSDFEKVCEILNITIIEDEDVKPLPFNQRQVFLENLLSKSLFVISCLETENWTERYQSYKQTLQKVEFYTCQAINLVYTVDESVSVNAQRFYSIDNQIYYVGAWSDRKVYADVVGTLHDYLGLSVDIEKAKQLFDPDETFFDVIKEDCKSLFSDDNFISTLKNLLPRVYNNLFPSQTEENDHEHFNKDSDMQYEDLEHEQHDIEENIDEHNYNQHNHDQSEESSYDKEVYEKWENDICDYIEGGFQLSPDEIIAENTITRWRVLNYLKENGIEYSIDPSFNEDMQKEYIQGDSMIIPLNNGKKLLAQSVRGGLWHISPNVWRGFENETLVVCLCTGNGNNDFKFAVSLDDIEEYADTPNVLVKISPKKKDSMMESINTVFPGKNNHKMNIHLMVKVHTTKNKKLDNIFDKAFNAPQDDYEF